MPKFFEERQRAAEMLFVRSEQSRFITHSHRVQSLASYAAEMLGVDRRSAISYADELMSAVIQGMDDCALVERVRADLAANGVVVESAILARQLSDRAYPAGPDPRAEADSDPNLSRSQAWS